MLQIEAFRRPWRPKIEDVVKENWLDRRDKLIRIGLSYDLAHAKGKVEENVVPKKVEHKKFKEKKAEEKKPEEEKVDEKKLEERVVDEKAKDVTTASSSTDVEPKSEAAAPASCPSGPPEETGLGAEPNSAPPPQPAHDEDSDDEDGEGYDAPWNAPLVVSLRVFCHKTAATIKVIRNYAEEVTAETKPELDVDDLEKDATKIVAADYVGKAEVKVDAGKEIELTLQPKAVW